MTYQKFAIVFLFPTFSYLVHSQLGVSYGETCGDTTLCDPRALLSCVNNSCSCIKPTEMVFDTDKKICVVKLDSKCAYPGEKLDCVNGSICNSEGYCECTNSEQYYGNSEGFCVQKGYFGASCSSDKECRKDKRLSCVDGFCSCNATEGVYDHENEICVGIVGTPCAYDYYYSGDPLYRRCIKNAYCLRQHNEQQESRCTCNHPRYLKTDNGHCLPAQETECDKEHPCHPEFACIDGFCRCHFSSHQTYNSTLEKCVSYVRGPCLEQIDGMSRSFPCVENAICDNSTGVNECICGSGWIESERVCRLSFGQSCSNQEIRVERNNYNYNYNNICDPSAGLLCRNEKCSCPDLQVYDEETFKCRGMIGAVCWSDKEGFCVDGAFCDFYRIPDDKKTKGICRCSLPYQSSSDRSKCEIIATSNGESLDNGPNQHILTKILPKLG